MATCPRCKKSSRDDSNLMTLTKTSYMFPGDDEKFSLAGEQIKIIARPVYKLTCVCGWSITCIYSGNDVIEYPPGQTPETRNELS